jgi:hypothetical protein
MQRKQSTAIFTGIFYDSPVEGLEFHTQTLSGTTNKKGEFQYRYGETITFSSGNLIIGSASGNKRLTPADMAIEVNGDIKKLRNQKVTNIARFIQSLDGNVENSITITPEIKEIVNKYRYKINLYLPS